MRNIPDEYRAFINFIILLSSPLWGMFITLYGASLLFRLTNPEEVAKGLPFLFVTALGGFLLGPLTSASVIFRNPVFALRSGAILTGLFLIGFYMEGSYDSRWIFAVDRNLPLVAWSACLLVAGIIVTKTRVDKASIS